MSKLTYGGHTYVIVKKPMNWSRSEANAEAMGGHLVNIESSSENNAIYSFVMNDAKTWEHHYIAPDGGGAEYIWIGASDLSREGSWRWSDNRAVRYSNWGYGGEPDNYNNQDAAGLGLEAWPYPSGGLGNPGQWNDIDVTNGLYSIVEFDGLAGSSKADKVEGTSKADKLLGLAGNDTLTGGKGKDAFVFNTKLNAKSNVDRIKDFSVKDDIIHLENAVFTKLKSGKLAVSAFQTSSAASDADDRIIYDNTTGSLYYDPDGIGSSRQIKFAMVAKGLALTAADFLVI